MNEIELSFILDVEDNWPPVGIENLPCTQLDILYRVEAPPLFVKDLSVGDVISIVQDSGGKVAAWSHVRKSNRTTIWLLRIASNSGDHIQAILKELRSMNCNTVQLPEYGCYSVDVPAECAIEDVDACLDKLDRARVAVAFPSFRH